jgi:hypothetical protein
VHVAPRTFVARRYGPYTVPVDRIRVILGAVVIALHFAVLKLFTTASDSRQRYIPATALVATGFVIASFDEPARIPSRSITLASPNLIRPTVHVDPPRLRIAEDSLNSSPIPMPPFTMARPDTSGGLQAALVKTTSLAVGRTVTIVLRLEVRVDGSVGKVLADEGSVSPKLMAEAIAHARKMRWIPATILGTPTTLIIRYPLVLIGAQP